MYYKYFQIWSFTLSGRINKLYTIIRSSISGRFKPHFRGIARGNRVIVHAWPEVTEVTSVTKVCSVHTRIFPVLFSYYSSSTKCTIAHAGSSMTTGSDIGPEVRVSRPFFRVFSDFRGFSLCCVVLQGCFLPRLRSHCDISTI